MLVSVIIPVYNAQKYLNKCITSVIDQTYRNLEIILIDDGSTDSSGDICDEYAKKSERVKVIHKDNGGLSSARNVGKRIAKGKYITYVDSDDYIAKNCIEIMVNMCQRADAQISIIQMLYVSENTNEEIQFLSNKKTRVLSAKSAIEESLYQRLFSCCTPAKLYAREIADGIDFPEGRLSEDLATCHLLLNSAKRIAYNNSIGYFYRQRTNSIMHTFNPNRIDALDWAKEIELFCKENYSQVIGAAECRTFNVAIHLALDLPETGVMHDKFKEIIWNEIKRTRFQAICNPKVRFREKAAAMLSFGGETLLRIVWNNKFAVKRKEM